MNSSTATNPTIAVQLRDQFESVKPDVSRTSLVKNEHSQFALIQLSAGTRLPEHSVPRSISLTVLDGHGVLTIEGREIALEYGVFVYISPNTPHALYATENLAFLHN
jgi:quercetin dioxygenase-like cupin family protein